LAFLRNPSVHSEVALSLLGGLKSTVCVLAICSALISQRKLEPWLARAILERWVDGQRRLLRLLASIPGTNVPRSVVPESQRLDLHELERQAVQREEYFRGVFQDPEAQLKS